jgi:PAS domain S-box-containing protein
MTEEQPPFAPFTASPPGVSKVCVLWCDSDAARTARARRLLANRAVVEAVPDAAAALALARAVLPDLAVVSAEHAPALAEAFAGDRRLSRLPIVPLAGNAVEAAALAGAIRAADVVAEPLSDFDLTARIGAQIEIVRLRRALAERELESETWLGLTLKASGLGVWHARLSSGELNIDANLAAMFGWPPKPMAVRDTDWLGRLHPDDRARFVAELTARRHDLKPLEIDFRVVHPDGTVRALAVLGAVVRHVDDVAHRSVGVARDVTERVRDAERQKLLLRELNHRVRNTLASVLALAQQTARHAPSVEAFHESFRARVMALGVAHGLLTRGNWQSASLGDLVETILAPERGSGPARFEIAGPACDLPPQKALAMTLGLHELATNARKYGALAAPAGRVSVTWSVAGHGPEPRLTLVWRESGGAPVAAPSDSGFGTRLLRQSLGADLAGTVRLAFDPAGLVCTFEFPLERAGG